MPSKTSSGSEQAAEPEQGGDGAGRARADGGAGPGGGGARTGGGGGASPGAAGGGGDGGRLVTGRRKRFLVAPRAATGGLQMAGLDPTAAPLSLDVLEQALRNHPEIEVVNRVSQRGNVGGLAAAGMGGGSGLLVARMSDQSAASLYQQGAGRLLVERDQHLQLSDPGMRLPSLVSGSMPGGPTVDVAIRVVGREQQPLADAEVSVFGSLLPVTGVTDASGQVLLALPAATARAVSGLYVKPKSDHWSFYQRDPDLDVGTPNLVALRALSDWPALADFPQRQSWGWGQRAMRLHQLPPQFRGQGVRVAVIDSGAATTHQNLEQVSQGLDIIEKNDAHGWTRDELGHGSHCSAIIAGSAIASGLRGFAPDAELFECKLFPGGQISQLIEALEYCIEQQIDVVNLSLGGAAPSEALEQQLLRARQAGIACIVAAGNAGGPVQYPASSPHVLAVAAIGKLGEFPADSYHAQTLSPTVDAEGYFQASFSCFGPEIAVCAPGVAIASAVPPNNFAAWDGTSMAAPHVTGLAALVLAHHPDFQGTYQRRGPERVDHLFRIITASARPVSIGERGHTGFGLPDVLVAVGLQAPRSQAISTSQAIGASLSGTSPHPASLQTPLSAQFMASAGSAQGPAGATQPLSPMSAAPGWLAGGALQSALFGGFW